MKKLHVGLTLVLVFIMLFSIMSVAAAVGEDAEFTIALVPTGTKNGLDADIVDAEPGGTVTVDVMLINDGDEETHVNAFGADIVFQEGLTYNSFAKDIAGTPRIKANGDKSKIRMTFVTNGIDDYIIDLAAGAAVKIGTLTLDVADSGLNGGDQLAITVDIDSDYTAVNITSTVQEKYPAAVNAVVEIAAQDSPSLGAPAPSGGEAEFTFALVPTGTKTELDADIVDAEAGGTVTVDLMLVNSGSGEAQVNAFGVDILFQEGLTYKSFAKDIAGNPKAKASGDKSKVRITFVTNGIDDYIIDLAAGAEVKIGTLTLDVADSGLNGGDQLAITIDTDSDYTAVNITSTVQEKYPVAANGKVEFVAQDGAAQNEPSGGDASANAGESEPEGPSTTGSVFGGAGKTAIIVAAILVIAAVVIAITRKKKN